MESCSGADLYSTCQPCILCAKMLINVGVKRIIYKGHTQIKCPWICLRSQDNPCAMGEEEKDGAEIDFLPKLNNLQPT